MMGRIFHLQNIIAIKLLDIYFVCLGYTDPVINFISAAADNDDNGRRLLFGQTSLSRHVTNIY